MFGIQDGGFCATSATAHETYNKYGESQDCKSDGKGGPWANQVYRFPERKGKFMLCDNRGGFFNPEVGGLAFLNPALHSTDIQSPLKLFYWK